MSDKKNRKQKKASSEQVVVAEQKENVSTPETKKTKVTINIKREDFKKIAIVLVILVVGLPLLDLLIQLSILNRYAAFVGNTQVLRQSYEQDLELKYGQNVVQDLIVEKIILNEMEKKKIVVDEQKVTTEFDNIKNQFSSEEEFNSLLKSERMTVDELKRRIKLKIGLDEIVKSEVADPKEEEIKAFFDQNATQYQGQKYEDVKDQIKETLKTALVAEKGDSWISDQLVAYNTSKNLTLPENNQYKFLGSFNLLSKLFGGN
jgi:hypothetical protein